MTWHQPRLYDVGLVEWFMAAVLKTVEGKTSVGSNPTPNANLNLCGGSDMSCSSEKIMKIVKDGPLVIFTLSDDSCVKYDLSKHRAIGKRGDYVKDLGSQLRGVTLDSVRDKFDDRGFYNYLVSLSSITGYKAMSLGTVLKRAEGYIYQEGYVRLGIKTNGYMNTPVSAIPKSILRWVTAKDNKANVVLSNPIVKSWIDYRDIFESMLSQRPDSYPNTFDYVFYMVSISFDSYGSCSIFQKLIDQYHCHVPSLINYIMYVIDREGLEYHHAIQYAHDYNMMQSKMCGGRVKYDKYPKHLASAHALVARNFNRINRIGCSDSEFVKTYDSSLETEIGKYVFICPKSISEIKDEAVQQQHCVASYIDNVVHGECHIIFMRYKKSPETSLITIDLVGSRIRHSAGMFNRDPSVEEMEALTQYERYLSPYARKGE